MCVRGMAAIIGILLGVTAGCAVAQSSDEFLIAAWCGIPNSYSTAARYTEMAQAGFTATNYDCGIGSGTVQVNKTILNLAYQHGMKAIIGDARIMNANPSDPNFASNIDAAVADYSSYPGLLGYFVMDEPAASAFPRLAAINQRLLEKDPSHLPYINLFCNTCVGDYGGYLDQFISVVKPKMLSYDNYTNMDGYDGFSYFGNLELIRGRALANNIPFMVVVDATQFNSSYRDPGLDDFRWQAYTTLAYGARGIMYFTYWAVSGFGPAITGPDGPTAHYPMVSDINAQIKALAPTLVQLRSTAVYHTGTIPSFCRALPPAGELISNVQGANTVVSFFTDSGGTPYVMLVNNDMQASHDIQFTFGHQVTLYEVSHVTGLPQAGVRQTVFTLPFLAGEGRLFRVDPTGIAIDSGAVYANSTSATLTLWAKDVVTGVSQMRFGYDGSSWSDWESYATSKSWTLTSGDGTKSVYVQFKDTAGNVSSSYTDLIILDATAPAGSIAINSGAAYTTSASVTLTLSATDAGSGVSQMRFRNTGSTWGDWLPYVTSKPWNLTSGDGTKSVDVQFKDVAGNVSNYTYSIILDTTAPTGSITIGSGADYTASTSVTLTLSATDAISGVSQMRLRNNGSSWGAWESYAATKPWTLPSGDGTKFVYAQFKDAAGNTGSTTFSAWVILDTIAPSTPGTPTDAGAYTASTSVTFNWTAATDDGSGLGSYTCQVGTTTGGSDVFDGSVGNVLTKTITGSFGSRYYCRVRAVDIAGNLSVWSDSSDGISVVSHAGVSIAQAQALADSESVGLASKTVSAVFDGYFYIEETDRSAGIRISPVGGVPPGLAVGKLVDVGGVMRTNSDHERWIEATVSVKN